MGFVTYASEERTVGVDISPIVLGKVKDAVSNAGFPKEGPGSIVFEEGNILEGLTTLTMCSTLSSALIPWHICHHSTFH